MTWRFFMLMIHITLYLCELIIMFVFAVWWQCVKQLYDKAADRVEGANTCLTIVQYLLPPTVIVHFVMQRCLPLWHYWSLLMWTCWLQYFCNIPYCLRRCSQRSGSLILKRTPCMLWCSEKRECSEEWKCSEGLICFAHFSALSAHWRREQGRSR